jgi:hypothetical protein
MSLLGLMRRCEDDGLMKEFGRRDCISEPAEALQAHVSNGTTGQGAWHILGQPREEVEAYTKGWDPSTGESGDVADMMPAWGK